MKLSKKGFEKILDSCQFDEARATYALNFSNPEKDYYFEIEETNFESNDFEDCVMLTVKEAKEILQSSYDVLSWSMVGPTHRDNALYVQKLLKYRIDQAEMKERIKGVEKKDEAR